MSESDNEMIPISAELVLAAILNTAGPLSIPVVALFDDYSTKRINADQEHDDFITFELIDSEVEDED